MESNRIELQTPLSPVECVARLSAVMDCEGTFTLSFASLFGTQPVVGRITKSSLRIRQRIGYRNSFQVYLTATLRPEGTGTVISGKFGMHPAVRAFMIFWFGGVALAGATALTSIWGRLHFHAQLPANSSYLVFIVIPLLIFLGLGLVRFGGYLARDEGPQLAEFLRHELDASIRTA